MVFQYYRPTLNITQLQRIKIHQLRMQGVFFSILIYIPEQSWMQSAVCFTVNVQAYIVDQEAGLIEEQEAPILHGSTLPRNRHQIKLLQGLCYSCVFSVECKRGGSNLHSVPVSQDSPSCTSCYTILSNIPGGFT